jgi:hypothetical protein
MIGRTFGSGLAGLDVCQGTAAAGGGPVDTVLLNYTVSGNSLASGDPTATHGVLTHFWVTGDAPAIDEVWVSYFVDGEASPSIEFQPGAMCGDFFPEQLNRTVPFLYSAGTLCGRNANAGGWFNTFPVPFGRSVVVTARPSAPWAAAHGCLHSYFNVRGTEGLPLTLPISGTPLPSAARLTLQRTDWTLRQPLEYVNVTSNPPGQRGLIFLVGFGVEARPAGGAAVGGGYIEGCWQFYRAAAEPFPGMVVGTGLEDYFDSAFYFGADTALGRGVRFANALAGLPFFRRDGATERLSAYRSHATDPLAFTDGGRLVWRVGEGHQPAAAAAAQPALRGRQQAPRIYTKCGNQYPTPAPTPVPAPAAGALPLSLLENAPARQISPVNVSTYGWVYVW